MYRVVLGEKMREGAPAGSRGLEIRPSNGELFTRITSKMDISPVALGGAAALAPSLVVMSPEALG